MKRLIAIAGGIGSGKSVVSKILTAMGYPVYDCDSRAKGLMDNDSHIKSRIKAEICGNAVRNDGVIDRGILSAVVFDDRDKLNKLNEIVHTAVKADIRSWAEAQSGSAWVESAIIYESGIAGMVDEVWEVTAPEELRVIRVMNRNSMTAEQVKQRIDAQSIPILNPHERVYTILNDDVQPILPQILTLLGNQSKF